MIQQRLVLEYEQNHTDGEWVYFKDWTGRGWELPLEVWQAMRNPSEVTVTIEPGNKLG